METVFKTAAKEAAKRILSPIYGAMEDIVELAVCHGAADSATSSRLGRLPEAQERTQIIVGFRKKMPVYTAPITQQVMNILKLLS